MAGVGTAPHVETTHLELRLDDVDAGAAFLTRVLGLPARRPDPDHVEIRLGPAVVAHLRPAPPRPPARVRRGPGTILMLQVPAVGPALTELRRRGATVLVEPVVTEWGTESAFMAGPEDVVIEVYRPLHD